MKGAGPIDYQNDIRAAVEYIENHLSDELKLEDCARAAHYSPYHFLRVFRQATGMTPGEYIRKRRLSEIAKRVFCGHSLFENASRWGFNSKEHFTRAFQAEHHCLPSEYRTAANSLELQERFSFAPENPLPPPRIEQRPGFAVIALPAPGHPPHFWNEYNCHGYSRVLSGGRDVEDYGICLFRPGRMEYYIGVREEETAPHRQDGILPVPPKRIAIPPVLSAVFLTPPCDRFHFVETIRRTWRTVGGWLDTHGYRRTGGPEYEYYAESSRTYRETIVIPIAPLSESENGGNISALRKDDPS